MKVINEIRVFEDRTLLTRKFINEREVLMRDGSIIRLRRDQEGRLVGGTLTQAGRPPQAGFVMRLTAATDVHRMERLADAGSPACYFCGRDPDAGVCYCYPISCELILGK